MNFHMINMIEKVKKFQVDDKNLMYCDKDLNIFLNRKKVAENNESYFCSNEFKGYHVDNRTYFINDLGEVVSQIDVIFYPQNYINNSFTTSKHYLKTARVSGKVTCFYSN